MTDSDPGFATHGIPGQENAMKAIETSTRFEKLVALAQRQEVKGNAPQAARFYRLAGEGAAAQHANETALEHFTKALSLTSDVQREERYGLLLGREHVLALLGDQAGMGNFPPWQAMPPMMKIF